MIIEKLTPGGEAELPGAMLHDWRGTAFVRGATVADFERLMKNFDAYPQRFAPQVMQTKILTRQDGGEPGHFTVSMRVRQHHVITVVMDTTYDTTFGRLDASHAYSISRSTHISEIGSPGTAKEHALSGSEEHGFLWRLNTYWSYEERDGGLYMQIESISLTRSIPAGLGWVDSAVRGERAARVAGVYAARGLQRVTQIAGDTEGDEHEIEHRNSRRIRGHSNPRDASTAL